MRNSRHRLIRTNHIAFVDNDDAVNQSVSRCHAHIAFDPATGVLSAGVDPRRDGAAAGP